MVILDKAYGFDDVCLVPQYNNVRSRTIPSLDTWLTKDTKIDMPLIPANMDTVICDRLADVILDNGAYPIFHRFTDIDTQKQWVEKYPNRCYISCGVNNRLENLKILLDNGARGVCIDIAHGHSITTIDLVKQLKQNFPDKEVIAGNVCTEMGYSDLVNAGADCVKVGIGPGSACTTRKVTGFGVPQFSAIHNISQVAKKLKVPIIADGGIRNSRDVVLALAAGASTCMIGGLFSKTFESAGKKYITYDNIRKQVFNGNPKVDLEKDGKQYLYTLGDSLPFEYEIYTHYRGQASRDFQEEYYGSLKEGTCPEGVDFYSKCTNNAQRVIDELLSGLRSGLTYGGAKSIKELQRKAEFVEVSNAYISDLNSK
tara:strand:- start:40 stop:1149 length:1110 start_codon:yes stop_codon:yes gene_type:complete